MAFSTIDKVREAELSAQKAVSEAQLAADNSEMLALKEADELIAAATDKANSEIAHREDRAKTAAEEIIVTSRNSTLLEAEQLRRLCEQKQSEVNSRVLEIII